MNEFTISELLLIETEFMALIESQPDDWDASSEKTTLVASIMRKLRSQIEAGS